MRKNNFNEALSNFFFYSVHFNVWHDLKIKLKKYASTVTLDLNNMFKIQLFHKSHLATFPYTY